MYETSTLFLILFYRKNPTSLFSKKEIWNIIWSDDGQYLDDPRALVNTFQHIVNQHIVEKMMSMFTDDASFEIVGLSRFSKKQNIKNVFEYDVGVSTNLKFTNCKSDGNTVHCQILERNDRLKAIGIDEHQYSSCIFSFKNNLIKRFKAEIPH